MKSNTSTSKEAFSAPAVKSVENTAELEMQERAKAEQERQKETAKLEKEIKELEGKEKKGLLAQLEKLLKWWKEYRLAVLKEKNQRGGLAKKLDKVEKDIKNLAAHGELTNELMGEMVDIFQNFETDSKKCQSVDDLKSAIKDMEQKMEEMKNKMANEPDYETKKGSVLDAVRDFGISPTDVKVVKKDGHFGLFISGVNDDEKNKEDNEDATVCFFIRFNDNGVPCISLPQICNELTTGQTMRDVLAECEVIEESDANELITDATIGTMLMRADLEEKQELAKDVLHQREALMKIRERMAYGERLAKISENGSLENGRYEGRYDGKSGAFVITDTLRDKSVQITCDNRDKVTERVYTIEEVSGGVHKRIGEVNLKSGKVFAIKADADKNPDLVGILNSEMLDTYMRFEFPEAKDLILDRLVTPEVLQKLVTPRAVHGYDELQKILAKQNSEIEDSRFNIHTTVPQNGQKHRNAFIKITDKSEQSKETVILNFDRNGKVRAINAQIPLSKEAQQATGKRVLTFELFKRNPSGAFSLSEEGSKAFLQGKLGFSQSCFNDLIRPAYESAAREAEEKHKVANMLNNLMDKKTPAVEQTSGSQKAISLESTSKEQVAEAYKQLRKNIAESASSNDIFPESAYELESISENIMMAFTRGDISADEAQTRLNNTQLSLEREIDMIERASVSEYPEINEDDIPPDLGNEAPYDFDEPAPNQNDEIEMG